MNIAVCRRQDQNDKSTVIPIYSFEGRIEVDEDLKELRLYSDNKLIQKDKYKSVVIKELVTNGRGGYKPGDFIFDEIVGNYEKIIIALMGQQLGNNAFKVTDIKETDKEIVKLEEEVVL